MKLVLTSFAFVWPSPSWGGYSWFSIPLPKAINLFGSDCWILVFWLYTFCGHSKSPTSLHRGSCCPQASSCMLSTHFCPLCPSGLAGFSAWSDSWLPPRFIFCSDSNPLIYRIFRCIYRSLRWLLRASLSDTPFYPFSQFTKEAAAEQTDTCEALKVSIVGKRAEQCLFSRASVPGHLMMLSGQCFRFSDKHLTGKSQSQCSLYSPKEQQFRQVRNPRVQASSCQDNIPPDSSICDCWSEPLQQSF